MSSTAGREAPKPTDEQAALIAAASGPESLFAKAYAGTGKTTTLSMMSSSIKVPAIALAFNRSIVKEFQGRFPGNFKVQSLNGLGYGALTRAYPTINKWVLEEKKLGKLITQTAKDRKVDLNGDQWDQLRQLVSRAMQAGIVPKDAGENPLLEDTRANWEGLANDLWISKDDFEFLFDLARDILERNVAQTCAGVISFDDQVYHATCVKGAWPQYPVLFVDEAQDLSPLNHQMVKKALRPDGKLVACGDPKQCHPPGTMIQLTGGRSKAIESLKIGDQLVSYNRKVGFSGIVSQGRKVKEINNFHFEGNLVRINTEGFFSHDCTPKHRCVVRWADKSGWCLYLMRRGNQFRLGTARSFYKTAADSFGPAMRARQEGADALWVLTVMDSKEAALIEEKVLWTKYGLPDLIFKCSGKASSTQEHLDAAWAKIGDNSSRAKQCLQHFRRDINFPLWEKTQQNSPIGERTFITQACNLISGVMSVKVFDGDAKCSTWSTIWLEYPEYNGPVIGIEVESNGFGQNLYVANGIVTHNSIYGFRGADTKSMTTMQNLRPNALHLPLAITFRCPKAIVARQQEHAPGYRAWHTNAEGRIARLTLKPAAEGEDQQGWTLPDLMALRPAENCSIAILCRNNGPLFAMAFKLLRRGVGVVMLGKEIGKGLAVLSRKIEPEDSSPIDVFLGKVADWEESERTLAIANKQEEKVAAIVDRAECLRAIASNSGVATAGDLRAQLAKLFARESGVITLASIHKSKGLEWDMVLHLDPWRIPSKFAKAAALVGDTSQLEQEWNLKYVAETRSKHTLVEASLEDFE